VSSTVANIDLTGAIRRLALASQVTLSRAARGGVYVDGRWVPADATDVQVTAVVQNYTDENQTLPEAVRTKRLIKVWSDSALKPAKRAEGTPGDRISWQGSPYEVYEFWDRSTDGNYWEALCVAVDQ
jgi:hypothetical protein